jgi:hypothetical protein
LDRNQVTFQNAQTKSLISMASLLISSLFFWTCGTHDVIPPVVDLISEEKTMEDAVTVDHDANN